jgi:nickel/cobalt exporter
VFAFLSGVLAGVLHVLSGPDHLAAVLPLAARAPERARGVGAVWGLGHGGGMLVWLVLALLFQRLLPIELISGCAEVLVGASLMLLGLWSLRERTRDEAERGEHRAALGMGVLHGTAGAGHLVGVLPLLGLSALGATLYCAGFALAGVLSMAGAGALMARITRGKRFAAYARPVCAFVAFGVGCLWMVGALLA